MSILNTILTAKRAELASAKARVPQSRLEQLAAERCGAPRGFAAALRSAGVRVIAEIKRASPSRGDICPDLDVGVLARAFAAGRAAALSVLTEPAFFKGCMHDLLQARAATDLPVLRKDFIIDPYQVYESAACGADALLLIVRMLDDETLGTLHALAQSLGMDVLCEVFDETDIARARKLGASLVGINNRDLASFTVDLDRTTRLARLLDPATPVIALSGIRTATDLQRNLSRGIRRFLIGETLMRQPDPAAVLRAWTTLSVSTHAHATS